MAGYELESVNLEVNIAADSNVSANITDAQSLNVTLGKAAELNVGQAVTYIESGRAELQPLVIAAAESASNAAESAASAAESADRAEAAAESIVSDKSYVYEQGIASDTWVIVHNLGKYPSVSLVDSAGTQFDADVEYNDENTCTVRMNGATTGKAFLN